MNEKIYCTSCGAENEAGAHFCVSCGTKLETHVQDQNPNTESLTGDVVSNNTQSTYTYTTLHSPHRLIIRFQRNLRKKAAILV